MTTQMVQFSDLSWPSVYYIATQIILQPRVKEWIISFILHLLLLSGFPASKFSLGTEEEAETDKNNPVQYMLQLQCSNSFLAFEQSLWLCGS